MADDFFNDVIEIFANAFDRFILAFTRIYDGLFDEKVRETIHGYDFVIVAVTCGFVLFFLRAEIVSFFGYFGKNRHLRHRKERIKSFIVSKDEDDDDDKDITIGRH